MKISKLFHWLYAIVMLLPIFAIGVTCGYAMFNKNAYKSYSNFNENEDRYVLVDNYNLITGREYKFISSNLNSSDVKTNLNGKLNLENFNLIQSDRDLSSYDLTKINGFSLYRYNNNIQFHLYSSTESLPEINFAAYSIQFTFTFLSYTQIDTNNNFKYYFDSLIYELPIQYQNNTIDNVFYYSIDKVQQSPLFNWAENSFLVTPFAYIVNLFSMPTNSPIVMFLSYWLAISIIWLVFDLIMYVPLLVHRWLDKGVLE